jgi:tRNA A-37 threonylcarbamoyl transferase component Bud32
VNAARFERVRELFDAAMDVPAQARLAWCEEACGDDPEVCAALLRLLERDLDMDERPLPSPAACIGAALDADAARRLTGAWIGRYQLLAEIGQGGMGRVFRAVRTDVDAPQEVALKLLRRELIDSTLLARFRTERRILAGLSHPGIARLLDLGESEDGVPYIVMELVRCEPITRHCARLGLGIRERLGLFRQVLAAVAHAHRNLIVHRDIKPANVLVDETGSVKRLDFGIAKPLHAAGDATATAARCLTPSYAAPEQFTGGAISVMSDVYALGALLHELLTGQPPLQLDGLGAAETERRVLKVPPAALRQTLVQDPQAMERLGRRDIGAWKRALAGDLDAIVHKALRKEPQSRCLGVEPFDADLASFLANRPVQASGSQRLYRTLKFIQRHRLMLGVVSGALTAVAIALTLAVRQAQVAEAERDGAQAAMAVLSESFRAADPMRLSDGQVSAAEILAAASRRTAALQEQQPQVHARLMAEIGEAELALGIVHPVHAGLDQPAAWAASADGDAALARRLRLLRARQLIAAHDLDGADRLLTALEQDTSQEPAAAVLTARAHYLIIARRIAEAVAVAARAEAALSGEAGSAGHVEAAWQLAEAQRLAERPQQALETLDRLLAQLAEKDHPRALLTRMRRERLLLANDEGDDRSLAEIEDLLRALERQFGATSTVLGIAHDLHAEALDHAGRPGAAIEANRRAIAALTASLGATHSNTLMARFNLAERLLAEREQSGHAAFAELLADAELGGQRDTRVGVFLRQAYASLLVKAGDTAAARRVLLPPGFAPRLAEMRPEIRSQLARDLDALFGPLSCAPDSAPADERSRAARIACAVDPLIGSRKTP